ncbi:MAG TPA: isoprenylcysteine carboxylmethyltransferase family protein [Candidatus Polarisedimenticolia bacterium]|nr:isoprenylcysteine carboxylmethyltransferase family protein [Candidatus Polarisedimenticolia bacterium]
MTSPRENELVGRIGRFCYTYRQYLSMALLAASILLARPMAGDARTNQAIHAAAFGLVLAGGAVRSWAMGYHVWRRVHGPGSERSLITAGPYALVRNPLYLGTLLISAGIALMSGSWAILIIYVVVFWLGYYAIILWEERRLGSQFGDRYGDYFRSVPRLVPALRVWGRREGTFSLSTMMRCMEPAKTVAFLLALALMLYLKQGRAPDA